MRSLFYLHHRHNFHLYLLFSYAFEFMGSVISDTASDHLEIAKKLLASGDYSGALPHFHDAISSDPNNYLTYFKRATVLLALNRPKAALEDLNKALELNKDFTSALSQRALLNVKLGNLDEAHIDYEQILKYEPDNADALAMYNKIEKLKEDFVDIEDLIEDNQYDSAIGPLSAMIELIPFNEKLLSMRAIAFEKVGEIRRAISDYRTIAKLKLDPSTYLIIAKLCYKLGEVEETLNNVRECLILDPDRKSCMDFYKPMKKLNNHIKNMIDSMNTKDNDDCYRQGKNALKVIKTNPSQLALLYSVQSVMCHCLSRAGDVQDGLKICNEALENSSDGGIEGISIDKAGILCDKADLLQDKEDYAEALKLYQQAHKLKSNSKRAREGIEKMQRAQKQKKKRDYYKILGVSRGASEAEINKAYRKLAVKWHPDRHQDEEAKKMAQAKFMDIADAKAVLTDPEKRQRYDSGEDPLDPESKQQHHHHGFHGDPFAQFGGAPFSFKFNF